MDVENRIRLEEFRQLKKEIRGSENHLIVGIDVAKNKHHAFFGMATRNTLLKRLVFENDREGSEKLLIYSDTEKAKNALETEVLAAIGNPFRLDSEKQILKMTVMDLRAKRSGKKSVSVIPKVSMKEKASLRSPFGSALGHEPFGSETCRRDLSTNSSRVAQGRTVRAEWSLGVEDCENKKYSLIDCSITNISPNL